ncbi:hypothetical protein MKZ21_30870 [Paenibacillus sp. FSL P2-0536]|uniref:hypothetical protein n=1 Tax=Paenibacillus sp. FSL P2-0536 TaxID=2921629 RepID=UPI0030F977CE
MTTEEMDVFKKGCIYIYFGRSRTNPKKTEKLTPAEEVIFKQIFESHINCMRDTRKKTIIIRRFGLCGAQRESLRTIGQILGITGSRVGQLEYKGILELFRAVYPKWRTLVFQ